jgi:phosphoglycerate dehydrogenase-like enzyme
LNVVFLNRLSEYWKPGISKLEKEFPDVTFIKNSNPDDKAKLLETAHVVITGILTEEEINSARNLKIIFVPFTGLNRFPLKLIKGRNILISNTHAQSKYVAEKAVALALALLGRVIEYHNGLKQGNWFRLFDEEDTWQTIQGKTCGILGYGSIGRNIAKLLKGFDCKIIGFKKHLGNHDKSEYEYADEITNNLNEALSKSEIIFVCLPLNTETKGLLSGKVLINLQGKYLINVARGEIISEDALFSALKNGTLAGAALDVWYNYPGKNLKELVFPSNKPIYELPNVVISPHKSSNTTDAINAMIDDTLENIRLYLLEGKTKSIIDKEQYY